MNIFDIVFKNAATPQQPKIPHVQPFGLAWVIAQQYEKLLDQDECEYMMIAPDYRIVHTFQFKPTYNWTDVLLKLDTIGTREEQAFIRACRPTTEDDLRRYAEMMFAYGQATQLNDEEFLEVWDIDNPLEGFTYVDANDVCCSYDTSWQPLPAWNKVNYGEVDSLPWDETVVVY